jgi:mono/diheme cytochrome c family protein
MSLLANGTGRLRRVRAAAIALAMVSCMALADGGWLKKVPADFHSRTNPVANDADAIAGGKKLFDNNCAKCHGDDALGIGKRPSLRSERVQKEATEGDIAWLLKNGNLGKGMPNWSTIPEPSRWQIVAYVKSLGEYSDPSPYPAASKEKKK